MSKYIISDSRFKSGNGLSTKNFCKLSLGFLSC